MADQKVFLVLEISPGGGVSIDTPLHGVFKTAKLARICARTFAGTEAKAFTNSDGMLCLQATPDLIIQVRPAYVIG